MPSTLRPPKPLSHPGTGSLDRCAARRYHALLDTLDAGFSVVEVMFDPDGSVENYRFLEVSASFERLTGLADPVGRTMRELEPRHEDHWFETYGRVARTGRPERFVKQARFLGDRWYEEYAFPIDEPGGRHVGVVFTDVTDRKRVEGQLFASRETLRAVIDNIPQRVFWKGTDLTYLGCNRPFARDMGYASPAEVVGKTDFEASWAAAAEGYRADDRRVIDTAMPKLGFEEVLPAADGGYSWVRTNKVPLRGHDGNVVGVLCTYEDVTDRRRIEEKVREQELLLREAAELAHVGGWSFDPVTLEGDWTSETARIHGLEQGSIPSFTDGLARFPPADRVRIEAAVQAARKHGTPYDLELDFVAADGVRKRVRAICRPVVEQGRVVRVRGSLQDVTERHRLEEQLRQSQKMEAFGQLAGGVAHDFNNMLQVIKGYADLLADRVPVGDPRSPLVDEIRNAANRSAALTRQLLAFSRRQAVSPRVVDMAAMAAGTVGMLRRLIGEDVRLETDLPPGIWPVFVDPGLLEQVLLNLAVNARDAMPGGGSLAVAARNEWVTADDAAVQEGAAPGPHAVLSVKDSGMGMPPEILTRIFEPFFTTKAVGKGTGLGLATVYGIVRQAGGHLRVRSEPGMGSTFEVFLPRVREGERAEESGTKSAHGTMPRGSETVMVVEDEPVVGAFVRTVLQDRGYIVLEASDAESAERIATGHPGPIHLVLSDVVMPGSGGRPAATRVLATHPEARVAFMSGYAGDAIARQGFSTEEVPFLQKPFSPATLAAMVRQVLDGAR